jgi:hypothetical protein
MSFYNKIKKMKDFYQSCGRTEAERLHAFLKRMDDIMASKGDEKPLMRPEDWSIAEIYEAVHPSAFPLVTKKLLSKKIMGAYTMADTIGDQLTETFTSNLIIDRIPGFSTGGNIEAVLPGANYQHTGVVEEKWVQIVGQKYGKILDITWEAIKFDQTGQILRRAGMIGKDAAIYREKMIMNTIQDIAGYYAWYVGSADAESVTRTALYSTSTTAPHRTSNQVTNALVNHTDINAAVILLGLMVDEKGDPIVVNPKTLLVPVALEMVARSIYNSTVLIGGANSQPNPFAGKFAPLSSPYLDAQSSIIWYLGDFASQFVWKEVIPLQVLTRKDEKNEPAWERDVVAQYKVRFYGDCKATDYCHVVKSTGAV